MITAIVRLCQQCEIDLALANSDYCQQCAEPGPFYQVEIFRGRGVRAVYTGYNLISTYVGEWEGDYRIEVSIQHPVTQNWSTQAYNLADYVIKIGAGIEALRIARKEHQAKVTYNARMIDRAADCQSEHLAMEGYR